MAAHSIHFDVLAELSYEDLKEMGVEPVGMRRRLHKAIAQFEAQREAAKASAALGAVEVGTAARPGGGGGERAGGSMEQRLNSIREVIGSVLPSAGKTR